MISGLQALHQARAAEAGDADDSDDDDDDADDADDDDDDDDNDDHTITKTNGFQFSFMNVASPQQGDLRLSGPPSGQGAGGGGARTRDRKISADLGADSLSTMPSMAPNGY
ncbi:hypothetical protein PoB_001657100 [Plakobranchus ocellatus]|uniref:Uncharacterized protein n=1 Tax=Plakobranchus ocellatus TaxID=259542 RepID=A0AAV3YSI5_9GAST|nr:hypothetical protein PoB_001657100 [Plakobranchus ocellatus]